jgi:hypothetical protein
VTNYTATTAPGTLPGRQRALPEGPQPSREGSRVNYGQPVRRPRPLLDSEPRRRPGLEVQALEYQSDPPSTRLDLRLVSPRQRPASANAQHRRAPPRAHHSIRDAPPYQFVVPRAGATGAVVVVVVVVPATRAIVNRHAQGARHEYVTWIVTGVPPAPRRSEGRSPSGPFPDRCDAIQRLPQVPSPNRRFRCIGGRRGPRRSRY